MEESRLDGAGALLGERKEFPVAFFLKWDEPRGGISTRWLLREGGDWASSPRGQLSLRARHLDS